MTKDASVVPILLSLCIAKYATSRFVGIRNTGVESRCKYFRCQLSTVVGLCEYIGHLSVVAFSRALAVLYKTCL